MILRPYNNNFKLSINLNKKILVPEDNWEKGK
jgi:hypothetical protein